MESLSRAVGRLPARWRRVLWLAEVEGREPGELAPLLGVDRAAAAALAVRAREGLRLSYLLVQLRPGTPAECRRTVDRLPAYARTALPPGVAEQVMEHVEACTFCRARSGELAELTSDLPGTLRPLLADGADVIESPAPAEDRSEEAPALGRDGAEGARRKVALATAGVAVTVVALMVATSVNRPPGRTSSQGFVPLPAVSGAPTETARPSGSAPPPRPMATLPPAESDRPVTAQAGKPRPRRHARVPLSRSSAAPRGGGAPPASSAPAPGPTTTPRPSPSPSLEVCVGVLVVRLCHGVG